jgi:hypothetical protein
LVNKSIALQNSHKNSRKKYQINIGFDSLFPRHIYVTLGSKGLKKDKIHYGKGQILDPLLLESQKMILVYLWYGVLKFQKCQRILIIDSLGDGENGYK